MAEPNFGGNWDADRKRRENAQKRRAAERADVQRVDALEQQRLIELANAHRHENSFFESVAAQLESGRSISQKQAAMLLKIAGEKGWSTRLATQSASASTATKQGKIERELCDYAGDDAELTGYAERCRDGAVLSNKERGRANWLLSQEGLR